VGIGEIKYRHGKQRQELLSRQTRSARASETITKPSASNEREGKLMNTYTYSVEQIIEIKANSPEEAEGLLPMYPLGYEGQAHYVTEETVELLSEREGE
jgi:phage-related baseplate assembly protein